MTLVFYISSIVALIATLFVITRTNAVHALLYLIVSLLAVALVFYTLGAPFIAALEIIIYAGAIMVLFIFVMMMLNLGEKSSKHERQWTPPSVFVIPTILCSILGVMFIYILAQGSPNAAGHSIVGPEEVGMSLFTTYLFGVELAALLLLAGLLGAFHIGRPEEPRPEEMPEYGHPLRGTAPPSPSSEEVKQ
jgi:NADH-quinone oxidoreductase subunit J